MLVMPAIVEMHDKATSHTFHMTLLCFMGSLLPALPLSDPCCVARSQTVLHSLLPVAVKERPSAH